jgi:Na+-driven multidrug efflux pump
MASLIVQLSIVGIVMKVFGIVVSIVIGISLGGQPIIGFNMGGRKCGACDVISFVFAIVFIMAAYFTH